MPEPLAVGTRVMVTYPYASPTPYEGEVLEHCASLNTYRVAMVSAPHYDPWLSRNQLEPIWSMI